MLAGKENLARVSPTPGFTKLINFFTINKTWRLVDLPGYGFAHVARSDKTLFNRAVNDYIKHRPNLCCVYALIDSGLEPQARDIEFIEWLARNSIQFVLVFTKTDREKPEVVQANIEAFKTRIAGWFEKLPEIFQCSSITGHGRNELLSVVDATLAAGPAPDPEPKPDSTPLPPEVEPPFSLKIRAGNEKKKTEVKKKKIKGGRPW